MKKILLLTIAVIAAFSLDAQELTIIHLNDTHSHIDPQRSGDEKGMGGVIEQAAYIDSVRVAEGKKNFLLLHAGDIGQGTSYFTEMEGNIEIDVMNAMKFDVTCLGNHEFDNGVDELARRLKKLKAKVVCANYDFSGCPLKKLVKPYTIVKRAGKKIGIIGLLTDISRVVDKDIAKDFTYQDPVAITNELAEYLKDTKNCDMVICLSHLGFNEDRELASKLKNIDLIIGGHSHTLLNDKHVIEDLDGEDVVVVQNWKWGLHLGQISVEWE